MHKQTIELQYGRSRLRLHYNLTGRPSRPCILLIHGLGCSLEYWSFLLKDQGIANKAFLIAVDLPGHGYSEKPKYFDYSMEAQAEVLKRFLEELAPNGPNAIVGFSMGGTIAIELWHKMRSEKLILVEPVLTERDVPISRILSKTPSFLLSILKPATLVIPGSFAKIHLKNPMPRSVEIVNQALRQTSGWAFKRCAQQLVRAACEPKTYRKFKEIRAEKMVVVRGDMKMPGFQPPKDLFSIVQKREIPETGHGVMLDNAKAFNKVIQEICN